jgi:hypothetical protein
MSTILQKYFSAGSAWRADRRPTLLLSSRRRISEYFSRLKKKCSICRVCVAIRKKCVHADDLEMLPSTPPKRPDERQIGRFAKAKKSAAEDAELAKLRGFFPA